MNAAVCYGLLIIQVWKSPYRLASVFLKHGADKLFFPLCLNLTALLWFWRSTQENNLSCSLAVFILVRYLKSQVIFLFEREKVTPKPRWVVKFPKPAFRTLFNHHLYKGEWEHYFAQSSKGWYSWLFGRKGAVRRERTKQAKRKSACAEAWKWTSLPPAGWRAVLRDVG